MSSSERAFDKSNSTFLASFKLIASGVLNAIVPKSKPASIRSISDEVGSVAGGGPAFVLVAAVALADVFLLTDVFALADVFVLDGAGVDTGPPSGGSVVSTVAVAAGVADGSGDANGVAVATGIASYRGSILGAARLAGLAVVDRLIGS